jgi:sigma-B regulation protein RsbU (phosphoserine phosphatase)
MGDVSGHGLGPAILASETRAYLRAFSQAYTSPGEILVLANRLLCDDMEGTQFVTLFLGRLEPKSRDVRFAAAGQRSFLLSEQGEWTTLDSGQPPLGLSENLVTGVEHQVHLPPGNLLLLLTDGIPESSPPGRKLRRRSMFGYPRVLDLVGECRDQPALEIINQLFHAVHRYTGTDREDDDMTVVLIKATE